MKEPVYWNRDILSYDQKHFNTVFQLIASKCMGLTSNTVFYAVATIDPFINGLCNDSMIRHINIFYNPIVNFGKINSSLILCNTSHVYSGDQYAYNMQELENN